MVAPTPGREPILALMPVPGDVDVVIAAELMEAGRAVERGFVTPQRTLVIASQHRAYAVPEKAGPGNALADSAAVQAIVAREARQLVVDDYQALAVRHGSVISAALFGALAGSQALPFTLQQFEAVVERSGVGVQASLAALRAAAQQVATATHATPIADPMLTAPRTLPERAAGATLQPLLDRIRAQFPPAAWDWLGEGLARVVDWQDEAYGTEYLDRVARLAARDDATHGHALTIEAARWIAVAMSYDDVIRVADLKTRAERAARLGRPDRPFTALARLAGAAARSRPPRPHAHRAWTSTAAPGCGTAPLATRQPPPCRRDGAPAGVARRGGACAGGGLCAGRRVVALPSTGQGLQRHARSRQWSLRAPA